jgi:hypothetical protein
MDDRTDGWMEKASRPRRPLLYVMGRPLSLLTTTTSKALKGRTVQELGSHMTFITLGRQALITLVMPLPDGLTLHLIHSQVKA